MSIHLWRALIGRTIIATLAFVTLAGLTGHAAVTRPEPFRLMINMNCIDPAYPQMGVHDCSDAHQ